MKELEVYVVGFGRPDLLPEQTRLLRKHVQDHHSITLIDNTPSPEAAAMEQVCRDVSIGYLHVPSKKNEHNEALNFAAGHAEERGSDYFGFLDHDVFPRRDARIIKTLDEVGFFGVGQRHGPTGRGYLWPGLCFFSRKWLGGRKLDFDGIRGDHKRHDGDCGSMNWPLFTDEDWRRMYGMEHGYAAVREPDDHGIQSWAYEILGDFIHFTNASNWMEIPNPEERDRLMLDLVRAL